MNWTELPCEQPHWNACVQNWLSTNRPSFAAANQVLNQWTRRVTGLTCYRSVQFSSVRARWSSLPVTASFHAVSLYITRPLVISVSRPSSSPKCIGYTSVDSIDLCYWAILQLFSHPVFSAHASICEAACRSCISGGFLSLCISFSCSRLRCFSGKAVVININRALNTNRHPG